MWLFAFSLIVIVCAAKCTDADVSVEAAFQGRCGHGSPCEQLCYELHDGMYECDCTEGFELNKNGYSCQEINSTTTDENSSDVEEDVLYQRGASFSAKLDMSDLHISMKTFDDDDDGDGEGSMKPININALDGTLSLRKANHNWKTNSSKAAASKLSSGGRGQTNFVNSSNNGDQKRPIIAGASDAARRSSSSKSDSSSSSTNSGSPSSRSVRMEITGDSSLHMQDTDGSNPGEIKALALTASFDDDFDSDRVEPVATVSPPAASEEGTMTTSGSSPGSTPVVTRPPCTLDCGYEGICSNGESSGQQQQQRCLCPFGKTGPRCEEGQIRREKRLADGGSSTQRIGSSHWKDRDVGRPSLEDYLAGRMRQIQETRKLGTIGRTTT